MQGKGEQMMDGIHQEAAETQHSEKVYSDLGGFKFLIFANDLCAFYSLASTFSGGVLVIGQTRQQQSIPASEPMEEIQRCDELGEADSACPG
ncbi:hypothetical protein EJB05_01441, partial [Eragrostis curvula]